MSGQRTANNGMYYEIQNTEVGYSVQTLEGGGLEAVRHRQKVEDGRDENGV